jgi:tRNA(Ile)-lysidine synthase
MADVSVPGHTVLEGLELGVSTEVRQRGDLNVAALPKSEAVFDWDALPKPLILRRRRDGDRMQPFGLAGSKRVSALLSDAGVASWRRDDVSVLCGGDVVLWVVGIRADGRYCVGSETARLLHVRSFPSDGADEL